MLTYERAFDALGEHTRRRILAQLGERPKSVGELAEYLPVTRQAVSQHLRVLKDAGLVAEHREGTRRIYRLDPRGVDGLRRAFDAMWQDALAAYQAVAEEEKEER